MIGLLTAGKNGWNDSNMNSLAISRFDRFTMHASRQQTHLVTHNGQPNMRDREIQDVKRRKMYLVSVYSNVGQLPVRLVSDTKSFAVHGEEGEKRWKNDRESGSSRKKGEEITLFSLSDRAGE